MNRNKKILAALIALIVFSLIAGMYFWPAATPEKQNNTNTPNETIPVKLKNFTEPKKATVVWEANKCSMHPDENKNEYDLRADIKNSSAEVEFQITYFNQDGSLVFGTKPSVFDLSPGHPILRTMTSPYGAYELLPLNFKVYINKTFSEEKMVNLTCIKESSSSSGTNTNTGSTSPTVSPTINPRPTEPTYTPPPTVTTARPTENPTPRPTTSPTTRPTPNPTPRHTCSVNR